jgi:hypothetical protein
MSDTNSTDSVTCSRCGAESCSIDGAMHARLTGFGDRGIIDTFHGDIGINLCHDCSEYLLRAEPWLLKEVTPALNINYAHECADGEVVWEPMPSCEADPERHGWKPAFVVVPAVPGSVGDRAPRRGPDGELAHFGCFDSEEAAAIRAESVTSAGVACRTARMPIGNADEFYSEVDPLEWAAWWPEFNRSWKRDESIRALRELAVFCARNPLAVARRPIETAKFSVRAVARAASAAVGRA